MQNGELYNSDTRRICQTVINHRTPQFERDLERPSGLTFLGKGSLGDTT